MSNEEDAGSPLEWSPQYLKADARRLRAELMAKDAELAEVSRQRDQATDGCAELSRALTRAVTAHDQLRADLARVTAERDECKAEHERLYNDYSALAGVLGAAHTERDALRAEVAAQKAGKWAGPWHAVPDGWGRSSPFTGAYFAAKVTRYPNRQYTAAALREVIARRIPSSEKARAVADEALRAAGWFLSDEPITEQVNAGSEKGSSNGD